MKKILILILILNMGCAKTTQQAPRERMMPVSMGMTVQNECGELLKVADKFMPVVIGACATHFCIKGTSHKTWSKKKYAVIIAAQLVMFSPLIKHYAVAGFDYIKSFFAKTEEEIKTDE
ncbi:MAG: hypothetical protein LE169_04445 [Endomicrobium sp.]|nr:hypothetical protein [Endomicrobium sp.]